ncbi:MAG TPA: TonB-dependent receptor, partial [Bacteroidetes bacterium]|nr:TonB-dependent receptor [Bacteroidota bacterium]
MKIVFTFLFSILFLIQIFSQKHTISGYIEDAETGEKLISAYIFDENSKKGTVTNAYGFYSLTLPKDSIKLIASYLGYSPAEKNFLLKKNISYDFKLEPANELQEIEITSERIEKIEEKSQMSQVDVPVKQIKSLPALFGEVDVLKTLQLLPGVQAGTEGTSGLYVRGGSPDQNLVLLDNVPVYNVSHFLGIFSVFNADALKNVSITKGGFPARYGGRLSSIIDINMKDGNMKGYHGNGSIGNITSKLMIEGPLVKDKASFIVSGRRTYADLFLRPLIKRAANSDGESVDLKLYFYDLNAKANYIINPKNRLYLSFYSGNDVFGFYNKSIYENNISENGGGINWGNTILALKWNSRLSPKLFLNSTVTYSNFNTLFKAEYSDTDTQIDQTESFLARYSSGIKDYAAKMDFDYIPLPNHYVKFGLGYINHTYNPGALNIRLQENSFQVDTTIGYNNAKSHEFDVYAEDDFSYGNLKANIGLHFSGFKTGNTFYNSFQPRLGLRYLVGNGIAIKASYATMKQYINLLTSESISTPLDLWVPSTERIKPQYSWQGALGIAKTFVNDIEFSLEGYYKEMENVISYKP